jgi:sporulation protein YlmC with PRC-barrel domain
MKAMRWFIIAAALLALPLSVASFAYGADDVRPHPGGLIETGWLIGRPVINTQGKEIGKIEHVWFDPKDGRVKELVISVGGVLGIGDKQKLVPWQDLTVAWEAQKLIVRIDENRLRGAAKYESTPSASPGSGTRPDAKRR